VGCIAWFELGIVKLELSRGVYFVEVVSGGKVIRERVIIR